MGLFWSISLRKQCMSARDSSSERVLDVIQSLRLDLAAIEAASRKAEVNLMGKTSPPWSVHSSNPNPKDPTK